MTSQFWNITQSRLVVSYRRFGTTDQSDLQGVPWVFFMNIFETPYGCHKHRWPIFFVNGLHGNLGGGWIIDLLRDCWLLRDLVYATVTWCFLSFCWFLSLTISHSFTPSLCKQYHKFCSSPQRSDRSCWPPIVLPNRYRVLGYRVLFSGR